MQPQIVPSGPGHLLDAMRRHAPQLLCMTAPAAMPLAADALLAAGARPAMADAREEASELVASADALAIATGMLSPGRLDAMLWTAETARARMRPWVLAPEGAELTATGRRAAAALLARGPTVLAGSPAEIRILSGVMPRPHGEPFTDAPDTTIPADVEAAARQVALRFGTVVAVGGDAGLVTDGDRVVRLGALEGTLRQVAGAPTALAATVAAFLAVHHDPYEAAATGLGFFALAAGRAGGGLRVAGPGSFAVALVDALAAIDGGTLDRLVLPG
jgi:hydroxyethylthiazole kinase